MLGPSSVLGRMGRLGRAPFFFNSLYLCVRLRGALAGGTDDSSVVPLEDSSGGVPADPSALPLGDPVGGSLEVPSLDIVYWRNAARF